MPVMLKFNKLNRLLVIGLLLAVSFGACTAEIQKSPFDNRQYKALTLDNGLRAVLVSDPDAELAAAALNVQVGSFQETPEREGLAHFLEHMLFMGTSKYPDAAEYSQYVSMHGGITNAYTADMNTQYFFTITPQNLPGALDRFAQFFIAPLFDAALVDQERNAVHSEYLLHVKEDPWRLNNLAGVTGNPQHPMRQFNIGSIETLGDTDRPRKVRDDLLEFYNKYYSAERMILVIVAPQSIAELESLARSNFSAVPTHATADTQFSTLAYTEKETGKKISMRSIGDYQEMELVFPLPPQYEHYDKQSIEYILYFINQSSPGSLQHALKEKNWIISSYTRANNITYSQDLATISFTLTDAGLQHVDEIVAYFFAYMDFMRQVGPQQAIFNDLVAAGEREFQYIEKQTPEQMVVMLPDLIEHYPIELILKADGFSQDTKFDPEHITSLMEYFKPANMRMYVINNKIKGANIEPHFNTAYTVADFTKKELSLWSHPSEKFKFALPEPNPFMPRDFTVQAASKSLSYEQLPHKVLERPGVSLWFKQDQSFKLPKENIVLLLAAPDMQSTARRALLQQFMLTALQDKLQYIEHDLHMAGVTAGVTVHQQGLILTLNMFSDNEIAVLEAIIQYVKDYKISAERFSAYYNDISRNLENFKQEKPFRQAAQIMNSLIKDPYWLPQDMLLEMPKVTQKDVEAYIAEFLTQVQVEALIHGNVNQKKAIKIASAVADQLQVNTERKQNAPLPELIKITSGTNLAYKFDPAHDDATIVSYLQAPGTGDKTIAINALLVDIVSVPIFEQLRTKEQLGYIVGVTPVRVREQPGMLFFIESPVQSPNFLRDRLQQFTQDFNVRLPNMSATDFANFKVSLKHKLLQKPTSLTEETMRYWEQIIAGTYRFDFYEDIAKQVDAIKLTDVVAYYNDVWLSVNTRKLISVVSVADQDYADGVAIDDISSFKAEEVYH